MALTTSEARLDFLRRLLADEPPLIVNTDPYYIGLVETDEHLVFLAVHARLQQVDGVAAVERTEFDECQTPLSVRWVLACACEELESAVLSGVGDAWSGLVLHGQTTRARGYPKA